MAKRDVILEAINEGGATKEFLMEIAEVDAKGLASQFTYMRLMGNCPVVDENGVFSIVTAEEWATIKEERASNSTATSKLTPEERLEKAEKSAEKARLATNKAAEALAKNEDSRKLQIRSEIAGLTYELRTLELDEANVAVDNR